MQTRNTPGSLHTALRLHFVDPQIGVATEGGSVNPANRRRHAQVSIVGRKLATLIEVMLVCVVVMSGQQFSHDAQIALAGGRVLPLCVERRGDDHQQAPGQPRQRTRSAFFLYWVFYLWIILHWYCRHQTSPLLRMMHEP